MFSLERRDLRFLFFHFGTRIRQFAVQKRRRSFGKLSLRPHVFVYEQGRQLAVYLLCQLRRISRVMNLEGEELSSISWGPHEFNLKVGPHLIDWIFGFEETAYPRRRGIKLKALYDRLQAGIAQNLLRSALQTILEIYVDVLHHV